MARYRAYIQGILYRVARYRAYRGYYTGWLDTGYTGDTIQGI